MAKGVNRVILLGNLGQDPEVKSMPNGNQVVSISVATSEKWKDKNTGQDQERTEWHRCVAFGKLAEICGQYLKKGSKVYIEGSLRTRKWQAQDGTDRYSTEIIFNEMQMLDSQGQQPQQPQYQQPQHQPQQQQPQGQQPQYQQPQQQQAQHQQSQGQQPQQAPAGMEPPPYDDDIPFFQFGSGLIV